MKFKKITDYKIHETTDYSLFKKIDGNRNVIDLHVKRLTESMSEQHLFTIIIVNEKYQIIDGQNRFEACKKLKIPVLYVIVKGYSLSEVQRLNNNNKVWKISDYIESYSHIGYEHYITYRDFQKKYGFGHNETIALLTGCVASCGSAMSKVMHGKLVIKNYQKAVSNAEKITAISEYYQGYKRRVFVYAMLDLFKNKEYNHQEFLNKLKYQSSKLVDSTTVKQYLMIIEEIYNYKRPQDKRVRLYK